MECRCCAMPAKVLLKTPCCKQLWCVPCLCGIRGLSRQCRCDQPVEQVQFDVLFLNKIDHSAVSFGTMIKVCECNGTRNGVIAQTPSGVRQTNSQGISAPEGSLLNFRGDGSFEIFSNKDWHGFSHLMWMPLS